MFRIIDDFAGANIKIHSIEGNTISLEQEIRDTGEWWFWWNFKIEVQTVQTLRFVFTNGNVVHKKGVCYRYETEEFAYDPNARISGNEFVFHFDKAGVWQFAFSIPYLIADWNGFIGSLPHTPNVVFVGTSEQGRPFQIIDENPSAQKAVVVTCRHHACESVASFSMEGMVRHWLSSKLSKSYRLIVFPFVDIDGVENGDQGKSRIPHDHNRDYIDEPIYESVRILKKIAEDMDVVCLFDLHCPAAYGGPHDHLSLIGLSAPYDEAQRKFSKLLKTTMDKRNCPIEYHEENNVPYGTLWNKGISSSCSGYFAKTGADLAFSFEHPFAGDMERPYTPNDLRAFGECFAVAVERYLGLEEEPYKKG